MYGGTQRLVRKAQYREIQSKKAGHHLHGDTLPLLVPVLVLYRLPQKNPQTKWSASFLVDIPRRWEPRAKQQQRVALADFSAAPWQGFEKSERRPSLGSLFPPQAAVASAAVRVLYRPALTWVSG